MRLLQSSGIGLGYGQVIGDVIARRMRNAATLQSPSGRPDLYRK